MPLRPQYHFRPSTKGFYAWNVAWLIDMAAELPVIAVPIRVIAELEQPYWYGSHDQNPTVKAVADHAKLIADADLAYPILLCAKGRVMDGMHRVAKAYLEARANVDAKRFQTTPDPHYTDVYPDDLPY